MKNLLRAIRRLPTWKRTAVILMAVAVAVTWGAACYFAATIWLL
jgi:hypothetical protein